MTLPSIVAALLARLAETIDDPEVDLPHSLGRFTEQVASAVPTFLGVSVEMTTLDSYLRVDAMNPGFTPESIRSSVRIPTSLALDTHPRRATSAPMIALIVYAAGPGALVDLAADLAWLTSLPLSAFDLDQHLSGPAPEQAIETSSVLNQAIGVLLGRGLTPEEARADIDRRAAETGATSAAIATAILADATSTPEPACTPEPPSAPP